MEEFVRTEMLVGKEGMEKLAKSRVVIFGIGGVGGYVCEALARSGVGNIVIVDNDVVSVSNINRQIIASKLTVGRLKTDVMKERIASINPSCEVEIHNVFYIPPENGIISEKDSFVVDAIDTVSGKIQIIMEARKCGVPVISSMGTGGKLRPDMLKVSDIYKTSVCPLAKVMRKELKARGVESLRVVYSEEAPAKSHDDGERIKDGKRPAVGSVSFVPPVAGMLMAAEVVRYLLEEK